MSADIVNLRQARKARSRTDKEKQAEQNRLFHGRSKAEKSLATALNQQAERLHEQGKLEKPDTSD